MQEILQILTPADHVFLVGLIENRVNFTSDSALRKCVAAVEQKDTEHTRAALNQLLVHEICYLGSSELAYVVRYLSGRTPGVSFQEMLQDVGKALKVEVPSIGTDREQLEALVTQYVTKQFSGISPEEQQQMLVDLGVERDKAAAFVKRSAGIFALPLLIQAFNAVVVEGLIKGIIFGAIAKIIGTQVAARLFSLLAGRFPWWLQWVGPAAWSISVTWTVLDLQGPALRKTIPVVLYLGLCAVRDRIHDA